MCSLFNLLITALLPRRPKGPPSDPWKTSFKPLKNIVHTPRELGSDTWPTSLDLHVSLSTSESWDDHVECVSPHQNARVHLHSASIRLRCASTCFSASIHCAETQFMYHSHCPFHHTKIQFFKNSLHVFNASMHFTFC